ncbi:MAG: hypothetical protein V4726_11020 [Verrucomicrobiota bacterium]
MGASQFYSIAVPTAVQGPRVSDTDGPQWDRAEATYLCQGDVAARGGFTKNSEFPDCPGLIITEIETESVANNGYLVRLTGKGIRGGGRRVYSSRQCFSGSELVNDLEIGGLPFQPFQKAWPAVDLVLTQTGFRQVIVGADTLLPQSMVGTAVGAPAVGNFPQAPDNPWTSVDKPLLHFPYGWVLMRIDSEPLKDGGYTDSGPWIAVYEYAFRWKITYGG